MEEAELMEVVDSEVTGVGKIMEVGNMAVDEITVVDETIELDEIIEVGIDKVGEVNVDEVEEVGVGATMSGCPLQHVLEVAENVELPAEDIEIRQRSVAENFEWRRDRRPTKRTLSMSMNSGAIIH